MAIPSIVQNHHSSILSLLFFHHLWVNETLAREGWKRETTKSERLPTSSHAHACPACRSYSIVGCGSAGWQGPKSNVNCYIYLWAKQQRGFSAVHWYFHFILNAILYACFTVFFSPSACYFVGWIWQKQQTNFHNLLPTFPTFSLLFELHAAKSQIICITNSMQATYTKSLPRHFSVSLTNTHVRKHILRPLSHPFPTETIDTIFFNTINFVDRNQPSALGEHTFCYTFPFGLTTLNTILFSSGVSSSLEYNRDSTPKHCRLIHTGRPEQ